MAQIQHCLMLCCCYQAFKLIKALKNFKAGICCVCFFLFRPNFLGSHHFSHHLSFGRNTQCKMASVSFSKLTGCSRIHVIIGRTIKAWAKTIQFVRNASPVQLCRQSSSHTVALTVQVATSSVKTVSILGKR